MSREALDALSSCLRRACGLPSTTRVGKGKTVVSATLVGDPDSRSRVILLRLGTGKHEKAVLWVSNRGGVLLLCFPGTQNALFLSISSRSSVCKLTTALRSCLSTAGIPVVTFLRRMHLGAAPKGFLRRQPPGPSTWLVLFRSVYLLVSFTGANLATCIAFSCRRFRARCGHVNLARPFNNEHRSDMESFARERTASPLNSVPTGDVTDPPAGLPEDDAGIEMEPGDTVRERADAAEATVSSRVRRNLLPCLGEIAAGEVWARTADWKPMYAMRASRNGTGRANDLQGASRLFEMCIKGGLVNDARLVHVEPYCGSCGCERDERHVVTKEPAVLYTHHPSAPTMRVSHLSLRFSMLALTLRGWYSLRW